MEKLLSCVGCRGVAWELGRRDYLVLITFFCKNCTIGTLLEMLDFPEGRSS